MTADVATRWARLADQLREACDRFITATRTLTQDDTAPYCCQALIGLTPSGVPINWHTPDCPGLEARLALFELGPCPATAPGLKVARRPAPLLRCVLDAGHQPPHRTLDGAAFQERVR